MRKWTGKNTICSCCDPTNSSFYLWWGAFFIVFGGYLLARHYGLIANDFPFWPAILFGAGLYFLAHHFKTK